MLVTMFVDCVCVKEENLLSDFGETTSRGFVSSTKLGLDSGAHGGCVFDEHC